MVCACGLRLKAPGATPGRVGRCPRCGGQIRVPQEPMTKPAAEIDPWEVPPTAYQIEPVAEPSAMANRPSRAGAAALPRARATKRPQVTTLADGPLPPLKAPETNPFTSILYPLRGAECLGVIAATSAVFWFFTILVPEYCLSLMGDADSMGVPSIGHLIALVSVLPFVILAPFVVLYWLQYLGRILVSSAMGETRPPRSPDRNFDGFFTGTSPWFIWLILGVGVGLAPLAYYLRSLGSWGEISMAATSVLFVLGLPYMTIALMLAFLHDDFLAPLPWNVVVAGVRLGIAGVLLCLFVASAVAIAVGLFTAARLLHAHHVAFYILCTLITWVIFQWTSVVAIRAMGTCYYHHRKTLKWHHERPRWGVAWRL